METKIIRWNQLICHPVDRARLFLDTEAIIPHVPCKFFIEFIKFGEQSSGEVLEHVSRGRLRIIQVHIFLAILFISMSQR